MQTLCAALQFRRLLGSGLLLLMAARSGWAQPVATPSLDSYEPGAGDAALQLLGKIFGSAGGVFKSPDIPWFNDAVLAFNLAVMAVAVLWFTWNVTSGIMQGSFDGEFMGQRYSSLWMPVRNVTGMIMLVPGFKGWSLGMLAMAYAASLGTGIGNSVATGIPLSAMPTATPTPVMPAPGEIAAAMAPRWDCLLAKRQAIQSLQRANVNPDEPSVNVIWTQRVEVKATEVRAVYGAQPAADGNTEDACGTVPYALAPTSESMSSMVKSAIRQGNDKFVSVFRGMNADFTALYQRASLVDPNDRDAQMQMRRDLAVGKAEIVKAWNADYVSYYGALAAIDQERAKAAVQASINKYGWMGAGLAGATAVWDSVQVALNAPEKKTETRGKAERTTATAAGDEAALADDGSAAAISGSIDAGKSAASGESCSWLTSPNVCMQNRMSSILKDGGIVSMLDGATGSPFTFAPLLGIKILKFVGWSVLLMLGVFTVAAIAATAGFGGGALGALFQTFVTIWWVLMVPLSFFALQLVVMLPATVVIAWVMAIGAYLVIVLEAFIATPLWAMAHLDTDGEGMGQRAGHGYLFLLNLLFRPAVLVIAVGFTYSFAEVIGTLMNTTLGTFAASMLKTAGTNPFSTLLLFIGALWLITVTNLKVAGISASLLSIIPNQIFTWIGGHFGSNVGHGVEQQVEGGFSGGANTASGTVRAAGGVAGAAAVRAGEEMQREQSKKAEEAKRAGEEARGMEAGTPEYEANVRKEQARLNIQETARERFDAERSSSGRISNGGSQAGGGDRGAPSGGKPGGRSGSGSPAGGAGGSTAGRETASTGGTPSGRSSAPMQGTIGGEGAAVSGGTAAPRTGERFASPGTTSAPPASGTPQIPGAAQNQPAVGKEGSDGAKPESGAGNAAPRKDTPGMDEA